MVEARFALARAVIGLFILLAMAMCILPFVHLLSMSLSSTGPILTGRVSLLPIELTLEWYREVFKDITILRSLYVTVVVTVIYTVLTLLMTVAGAYPLSKKRLAGRSYFLVYIVVTMYFSGGLIPLYLVVRSLGLLNTLWSLILPSVISAFNLIILKTFFESIPLSLEESAYIDGASDIVTLLRIYLPLSKPALATICLFYAVSRWNRFQDALFYISKPELYPLQMRLSFMVMNSALQEVLAQEGFIARNVKTIVQEGIKAATLIVATVPILVVYPWLQRYFIRGAMIGAIKG